MDLRLGEGNFSLERRREEIGWGLVVRFSFFLAGTRTKSEWSFATVNYRPVGRRNYYAPVFVLMLLFFPVYVFSSCCLATALQLLTQCWLRHCNRDSPTGCFFIVQLATETRDAIAIARKTDTISRFRPLASRDFRVAVSRKSLERL